MKKYFICASIFLTIGIFNTTVSHILCYIFLDDLNCHNALDWLCIMWDNAEYYIAHKFLSLIVYYTGLWGFIGSIIWYIEEIYLHKFIQSTLGLVSNIFGIGITMIISFLIIYWFGNLLHLTELFDYFYLLVNS